MNRARPARRSEAERRARKQAIADSMRARSDARSERARAQTWSR